MRRRDFLAATAAATAGLAVGCGSRTEPPGLDILVLGGTNFVGPAVVERAIARGHRVTLFNRGITRPELFPNLEKLRGDRLRGIAGLESLGTERRWDAVIDVWPDRSEVVAAALSVLRDRADYYYFVSSIAVYSDFSAVGLREDAAVRLDQPGTYGGEKALAERAVTTAFPDRSGVARCHAIVGPRDPGTSYHYWLRRLAEQDEVLAPGTGEDPVQLIDVRDLAIWTVDCIEQRRAGTFNVLGPETPLSIRSFLERSRAGIGSEAHLTWVDADVLREDHGVASFSDMPLWAPLDEDPGFYQISNARAVRAGLRLRPLEETARASWDWFRSHFFRDTTFPIGGSGISRERERAILHAWRQRAGSP